MKTTFLHPKTVLSVLACGLFSLSVLASGLGWKTQDHDVPPANKKYYQVVFVWVKNPQKYQEYVQKLGPVVSKYGSNAERIVSPVSTFFAVKKGDELTQPDMVNIVYYDSKEAYLRFEKDPDFIALKALRAEAIDIAGIDGEVMEGEVNKGGVADRLYMIEFLNYKNEKMYRDYVKKTAKYYKKHNLITERVLKPDNAFGNINKPDVVNIKYIKTAADKVQMENDTDHARVEGLYGDMIADLIWIEGKAAFVNMD